MNAPRKCVIGVGSPHGDDQIGWLIADAVHVLAADRCSVHKVASPLEILNWIDDAEWLGICDACRGTGHIGDWNSWTWPDDRIVTQEFAGSHDVGLSATLNLAARLERLPTAIRIWGIEIGDCQPGDHVSRAAKAAISAVANAIVREIMLAGGDHHA